MTREEILSRWPNASEATIVRNLHPERAGKTPILECPSENESVAADCCQEKAAKRFHIRFVSHRKRLCDPDNLSVKWLLDCLRYCGAIAGDEPEKIDLQVSQRKITKQEIERTEIEIVAYE